MARQYPQEWLDKAAEHPITAKSPAALAKAIVAHRDKLKLRWEVIAIAAGISPGKVKTIYTETTGTPFTESFTGRGRDFRKSPAKPAAAKPAAAKPAAAKPAAAKKPVRLKPRKGSAANPS